jgi:hypothetical protein
MKKLLALSFAVCLAAAQFSAQAAPRNTPRRTPRNAPARTQARPPADAATPAAAPGQVNAFSSVYDEAMKGDLERQRQLAFGYSSTPLEGQQIDPVQGCAWYIVVANSGSKEVVPTDASNQKLFCGNLSQSFQTTAQSEAAKLLKQIYNK